MINERSAPCRNHSLSPRTTTHLAGRHVVKSECTPLSDCKQAALLYSTSSSSVLTAALLPFFAPLVAFAFFLGASATSSPSPSASSSSSSATAAAFLPFFSLTALVVFFSEAFGTSSLSSSWPASSAWSTSSVSAAALCFLVVVAAPSADLESVPRRRNRLAKPS